MTPPEVIAACMEKTQRPFLVIGGHAVIAHGHSRNTIDLDLLTRISDRERWANVLADLGYESRHSHQNFEQFQSARGDIDVDLMFVNDTTFDGMFAESCEFNFGEVPVRIPSLRHLIALKLHVLKQGLRHRTLGDLDDVIQLVLTNRVDPGRSEWQEIFLKYGDDKIYEKVRHATKIE